jgi:hypothetical protein
MDNRPDLSREVILVSDVLASLDASPRDPEQDPEPAKRDPDPTAPGAPGERVERRG